MLLALYQGLVAELIEQGALAPAPLADRLARADATIGPNPHGAPARDMLGHVVDWLRSIEPGLPPRHPERWFAPANAPDES
jgi:hypothetical protein